MFLVFCLPVSSFVRFGNTVSLLILSMKRSQAVLQSRVLCAPDSCSRYGTPHTFSEESLLRYFPQRNSLAAYSSSALFPSVGGGLAAARESPYKFQSLSVSRSKFIKSSQRRSYHKHLCVLAPVQPGSGSAVLPQSKSALIFLPVQHPGQTKSSQNMAHFV